MHSYQICHRGSGEANQANIAVRVTCRVRRPVASTLTVALGSATLYTTPVFSSGS